MSAKAATDGDSIMTRDFRVANKLGIHARPAAMFVKTANRFACDIFVEKDGEKVNGKSIMGLMMLAALQALQQDAATTVIVLISKPPAQAVARHLGIAAHADEDTRSLRVHRAGGHGLLGGGEQEGLQQEQEKAPFF